MAMRALDSWRDLERRAGENLLVQTGGLDFGPGVDECAEAMTECGLPGEWLSARETEERFPVFSLKGVDRVLWHEQTGICLADRAVAAQARLAREAGVDVREETPMTGVRPSGDGVVVETESGEIEATVVVVAGGGWNAWILDGALRAFADGGAPLPSTSPRGWCRRCRTSATSGRATGGRVAGADRVARAHVVRGAGGDGPGIKVGRHMAGRAVNPSDGPFETLDEFQRDCAEYVRDRCPGLEPEPVEAETCLYTMTADEDFVLDRVGPIVVGGGCSGHGFKFGPLLARSSPTWRWTAILASPVTGSRRSGPRSRAPSPSEYRPGGWLRVWGGLSKVKRSVRISKRAGSLSRVSAPPVTEKRGFSMRRLMLLLGVLFLLALPQLASALPAGSIVGLPAWDAVPTPSQGLLGIAAVSPTDIWAVGGRSGHTLVEHSVGAGFEVVRSPSRPDRANVLEDIAGAASDDLWAVGHSDVTDFVGALTLAEHWNGSSWRIVKTPNVGDQETQNELTGVAAVAPDDVWAVGSATDFHPGGTPLIFH